MEALVREQPRLHTDDDLAAVIKPTRPHTPKIRIPDKKERPPYKAEPDLQNSRWLLIAESIEEIYIHGTLDTKSYVKVYDLIHTFCTDARAGSKVAGREGATLRGQMLYDNLIAYVNLRIRGIRQKAAEVSDVDLLSFYAEQWELFHRAAIKAAKVFAFVDRHWVKREQDEGLEVPSILDTHMKSWNINFLDPSHDRFESIARAWNFAETTDAERKARDMFLESIDVLRTSSARWLSSTKHMGHLRDPWERLFRVKPEICDIPVTMMDRKDPMASGWMRVLRAPDGEELDVRSDTSDEYLSSEDGPAGEDGAT